MKGVEAPGIVCGKFAPGAHLRKPGVLFRLTLCAVLLLGFGHVSSEERNGIFKEIDGAKWNAEIVEGTARAVDGGVAVAVTHSDKKAEVAGADPRESDEGDARATEPVDEGAGEVLVNVGECVGKRFKKCR